MGSKTNVVDVLRGLGDFIERLSSLSSESEWGHSGSATDARTGAKAVYGVSVRVGRGGRTHFERFGSVSTNASAAPGEDVREPILDLFDEGDHLRLVAELPGVGADDIRIEVHDNVLSLSAGGDARHYTKQVDLPAAVRPSEATSSYRNGIFELKLPKAGGPEVSRS
jgi:HSP20 family protein